MKTRFNFFQHVIHLRGLPICHLRALYEHTQPLWRYNKQTTNCVYL